MYVYIQRKVTLVINTYKTKKHKQPEENYILLQLLYTIYGENIIVQFPIICVVSFVYFVIKLIHL